MINKKTDFGYEKVTLSEKTSRVEKVFHLFPMITI